MLTKGREQGLRGADVAGWMLVALVGIPLLLIFGCCVMGLVMSLVSVTAPGVVTP